MAFKSGLFSFVYRLPVDDYKYVHTMMISGATSDADALHHFFNRHTNPDAEIVGYKEIASPAEHAEIVAKALKDGECRPVGPGEAHLTKADVAARGGPSVGAPTGELIVPTAAQVEAIRKAKGIA